MSPKAPIPDQYQGLRAVTAAEMAELDRAASERFRISALDLMENAGRAVAEETADFLEKNLHKSVEGAKALVCCGRGNNGGDGLVAARYLAGKGAACEAFLAPPRDGGYGAEVRENLRRAKEAGVPVLELKEDSAELDRALAEADVLVDALLGTGSSGKPAGVVRAAIQKMTRSGKPVIAVDIPSGLQPDTGYHSGVFVRAARTLCIGLPKRGLLAPHAQPNVGELKVLDIGFPKELIKETPATKRGARG